MSRRVPTDYTHQWKAVDALMRCHHCDMERRTARTPEGFLLEYRAPGGAWTAAGREPWCPRYETATVLHFRRGRQISTTVPAPVACRFPRGPLVYFVAPRYGGLIKIGFTAGDLEERLGGLQCGSPVPLVVRAWRFGDQSLEKELHDRFAPDRRHGEWFSPTMPLLRLMDSCEQMGRP